MTRHVLVVGAGMAGASSAWWLARAGLRVTVLEREQSAGLHSSGLNAAIQRSAIAAAPTRELALESAAFLRRPPTGFSEVPLLDPCGLLVYEGASPTAPLPSWVEPLEAAGVSRRIDERAARRVAPHAVGLGARAHWLPEEGRIDISALLDAFLRGARRAGAEVRFGAQVASLQRSPAGAVQGVELQGGSHLEADFTLLANGGWALELARQAGLEVPMTVTRRHLMVSAPEPDLNAHWPVVWDDYSGFYARPESGGMLLCACDLSETDPDALQRDDEVVQAALEKAARQLPCMPDPRAAHFWPGLRTLASDDTPILGRDPAVEGLAWAAGLGGHGMSTAAALGRVVVESIQGERGPEDPYSRGRFQSLLTPR